MSTTRTPGRRSFLGPAIPVLVLLGAMWLLELFDALPGVFLDQHGIRPRDTDGLYGIAAAPFLHGGFDHLIANSTAFVVLGILLAYTARSRFWPATFGIVLLGGLGTWLIGAPYTVHIGASGLIYGYAAFLVVWGIVTRRLLSVLVAVVVAVMYGGIVGGILPGQAGISWEGHLMGAVAGVVMAWWLGRRDNHERRQPQRSRFS
ncbi:rhomboid family intramembrane serine protease [Mumia sp. zg.B53]|uniref:rhomboid family intramembrane serine protease n=1 Tax=unclassified Mumia TaxID=2621872 RepID=UPI001C6F29DB|nr:MULTISPECIES: rhomboid family intramembrane serine protease [unclassified Mumia]MBW9206161.1 rhomboid family intramembrane serine protease [Mumia sp. zg.B17]MBW9211545.1 rhomboid family intramembrane serine protease [Mumia sp. zg.B21]MBW9216718.1 rhomboid family intramembrane serine protease [Mumia sp. zg.B53]MDD9350066.1 rhomboid family intramembrane serine protease [Mumia sp.]